MVAGLDWVEYYQFNELMFGWILLLKYNSNIRDMVDHLDDESHDYQASEKEESNNSLVDILVRLALWSIPRNIAAQAYSGPGYEHIVGAVKVGPAGLQLQQNQGREHNEEQEEHTDED